MFAFDDVGEGGTGGGEDGFEVGEDLLGLGLYATLDDRAGLGVERCLAGQEEQPALAYGVGVGADSRRRGRGMDSISSHDIKPRSVTVA
jgi:hypothetical protein